ncbi:MAG: bifunctional phosphoribosylaminoimidazolecarboxamide formyltransferase/IMP cyclohydrolase [Candidatus Zixiibacteriota bacterium]
MEADKKNKAVRVRRALLSVSDKTGIVEFAKKLCEMDIEIISTGGTKRVLKEAGVQVLPVSSFTGAPEILDGRVKTLHPAVHGGILYKRDNTDHVKQMREHDMRAIDMVVVNLYPFEETVERPDATDDEIIENIDIGGPSMVRSAAKNHNDVVVVTEPAQYGPIVEEMAAADGSISYETRFNCAKRAFKLTARYDSMIAAYFGREDAGKSDEFPDSLKPEYSRMTSLRYGENPHQKAAIYSLVGHSGPSLVDAQILAGKELSYNNYNDLEAVLGMLLDFEEPFACVVKHTNPCGAAVAETSTEAYKLAYESDPMSAFGSIIGINRFVDMEIAMLLHETPFVECIIAPGYSDEAVEMMRKKKARRLLALPSIAPGRHGKVRQTFLQGGLLAQTVDNYRVTREDLKVVSKVQPNEGQIESMLFGFQIVKHIKSNAIVLVQGKQTVGVGCGQTSRVDASLMAAYKAGDRSNGAVLASDAFFPMRDGIDKAAEAGVVAIIQPGGSKRDDEAIEAADEHKMAMVLTGIRHFKH